LASGALALQELLRLKTYHLTLLPHQPQHLLALLDGPEQYEEISGMRVAHGVREFLRAASPDFVVQLQEATAPDPWKFGFAIVHTAETLVIGMCGFAGPLGADGAAEIAYSIAPEFRGRGYATEAAETLVGFAINSGRVTKVCAYTLLEINASTRVLEKCGFRKIGEITDLEGNHVWHWERRVKNDECLMTKE
jgi:ribosomal-protein-alanine N-acetyltransferase